MSNWTNGRDKVLDEINKEAREAWAASWQMCIAIFVFGLLTGWFVNSFLGIVR